ncbi:hypothetical protein ACIHCV_38880 [Streptomyces sp. NPDC051956]|uniref:hypothetical protein n=1 Tax=Streptomyces sp. NPDC051956 TaxID=3365677 RepID=UPI0037D2A4B5
MLISHSVDGDALHVTLHHNVDVNTRVAAAVEIEALVHTHRPSRVTVQVPAGEPTPATLSVLVRRDFTASRPGTRLVGDMTEPPARTTSPAPGRSVLHAGRHPRALHRRAHRTP